MPIQPLQAPPVTQPAQSDIGSALSRAVSSYARISMLSKQQERDEQRFAREKQEWDRQDKVRETIASGVKTGEYKMGAGADQPFFEKIDAIDPETGNKMRAEEMSFEVSRQGKEKELIGLNKAQLDQREDALKRVAKVFKGVNAENWKPKTEEYINGLPEAMRKIVRQQIPEDYPGPDEINRFVVEHTDEMEILKRAKINAEIKAKEAETEEKKSGSALNRSKAGWYDRRTGTTGKDAKPPTPQAALARISTIEKQWADFQTKGKVDPMAKVFAASLGVELEEGGPIPQEVKDRLRATMDEEIGYLRQYTPRKEEPTAIAQPTDMSMGEPAKIEAGALAPVPETSNTPQAQQPQSALTPTAEQSPKTLTKEDARKLLIETKGDKEQARRLARERGYTF